MSTKLLDFLNFLKTLVAKRLLSVIIGIFILIGSKTDSDFNHNIRATHIIRKQFGSGSGVAIDRHHLLTCAHCAALPTWSPDFDVEFTDPKTGLPDHYVKIKLIKYSLESDLALYECEEEFKDFVRFDEEVNIGEELYAIGGKYCYRPYDIRTGFLTSKGWFANKPFFYSTSVPLMMGDSGGGMFSKLTNRCVGLSASITQDRWGQPQDVGIFVSAKEIIKFLQE